MSGCTAIVPAIVQEICNEFQNGHAV